MEDIDDDDMTLAELEMLQESYKEALMIQAGLKKGTPVSELWDN
jgi:hypothetical protein